MCLDVLISANSGIGSALAGVDRCQDVEAHVEYCRYASCTTLRSFFIKASVGAGSPLATMRYMKTLTLVLGAQVI